MKKEKHTCVLIIIESQVKVSHVVNISPLSLALQSSVCYSILEHLQIAGSIFFLLKKRIHSVLTSFKGVTTKEVGIFVMNCF